MATEQSVIALIRASRPTFRNDHDKVAFAVHASFLAAGYILNATGPPAFTDDALTSTSTDEVGTEHWNEFEDDYAFVYVDPNKRSKKVLMKCLAMNDKLFVDAFSDSSSEPVHSELNVPDYVEENGGTNYGSQFKGLGKLVAKVDKDIVSKLSGSSAESSSSLPSSAEIRGGQRDCQVDEPPGPYYYSGVVVPPIYPASGGSDLFPGPGAGMFPTRSDFGGGSLYIGPNDPRFFGERGGEPGFPGRQPGVPPGARFDPYGPPGVPGFEPGRFARNPRRPGGGTHPDLEHFGSGSDFI